jgi:hypothetical protein
MAIMGRSRALERAMVDQDWHEAMMAQGPQGFMRKRGATSWDMLHYLCAVLMAHWERLPAHKREAYAYRNPEDRRRAS